MGYITKYQIIDVQDSNRYYKKGASYPHKYSNVSDERVKELLEKGHIKSDGVEEVEAPEVVKETETEKAEVVETIKVVENEVKMIPYGEFTVKELKDIAKENGLEGYSDLKKDELIELLEQE